MASLEDLVESFVGTSYAETSAALTAIRAMTPDEVMAARIGRELAVRRQMLEGLDRQVGGRFQLQNRAELVLRGKRPADLTAAQADHRAARPLAVSVRRLVFVVRH